MRTYIVDKSFGGEKRETRPPKDVELSPRPERDETRYVVPHMMSPSFLSSASILDHDVMFERHEEVFETHKIMTMMWQEEYRSGSVSFGQYQRFISYVQLPQGIDIHGLFNTYDSEIDMYIGSNTTPFRHDTESSYRLRIIELEQRIRDIESGDRLILPREEINDIHNGTRDCHDKPVPVQYFDETIFKME